MLPLNGAMRIFLYRGVTDMRRSFDGLSGMVQGVLAEDPFSGKLFVFCNRRRDRVKLLYWDGDGFALWYKRLEEGSFRIPDGRTEKMELSKGELSMLLEGILPLRVSKRYRRPAAANRRAEETSR